MKILVLGKNGYVSTCFQNYMKKYPEIQVDAISVRNDAWKSYSFEGYDAVFNATGLAHNDARKGTEDEFMNLNVHLPEQFAKKAKSENVPVFIHMSSLIIYGQTTSIGKFTPITEDTTPEPDNIYGKSKYLGEQAVMKQADDKFSVAIIRSGRVYGENDPDTIKMLVKFAKTMPIFPKMDNSISMVYTDNLCELVRLIAATKQGGTYYPQQERYICTSKLVKDISVASGHKLFLTKVFNPILCLIGKKVRLVSKVFGNEGFDMSVSNHFDGKYRVVSYEESVDRLAGMKGK